MPGEPDAPMRAASQDSPGVSFVFLGSKRSLMDALFSRGDQDGVVRSVLG